MVDLKGCPFCGRKIQEYSYKFSKGSSFGAPSSYGVSELECVCYNCGTKIIINSNLMITDKELNSIDAVDIWQMREVEDGD